MITAGQPAVASLRMGKSIGWNDLEFALIRALPEQPKSRCVLAFEIGNGQFVPPGPRDIDLSVSRVLVRMHVGIFDHDLTGDTHAYAVVRLCCNEPPTGLGEL